MVICLTSTIDRLITPLNAPVKAFFEEGGNGKRQEPFAVADALLNSLADPDLEITVQQLQALSRR